MISLKLPNHIENRLEYLAKVTGRSKSFYVREAILKHIEELEDIYLSEKTLEEVRSRQEKIYSSDELERFLAVKH